MLTIVMLILFASFMSASPSDDIFVDRVTETSSKFVILDDSGCIITGHRVYVDVRSYNEEYSTTVKIYNPNAVTISVIPTLGVYPSNVTRLIDNPVCVDFFVNPSNKVIILPRRSVEFTVTCSVSKYSGLKLELCDFFCKFKLVD
ncbi:MAG: hypothetical protein ACTSW1_15590 [Candidatus Hodarchaeales archaeon]